MSKTEYLRGVKLEDVFYKALLARDYRFDGKFFVGVKTTGIYCRPICPVKPKRCNVEFFQTYVAAELAGYRPCLRCRPESAPCSPAWIGKSAIVRRALRLIQEQHALALNEVQFAASFGVSARHLRRVFIKEVGKTPKQLSFENRLNLARKLIVETNISITEIAFISGFRSLRRFNDAFKDRFKKSPRTFRRRQNSKGSHLVLTLSYRPPFDYKGLLEFYKAHKMGNLEWFDGEIMYRVVEIQGKIGTVAISNDPENSCLAVDVDFPDMTQLQQILSRVRAMFDLDSDPLVIANSLELDTSLKEMLMRNSGIRLPSGWDGFEVAIAAILGQLVSVERGSALVGDLVELLGRDTGLKVSGKPIKLFPTPKQIAEADLTSLKTTQARKQTLVAFSKAILGRKISLEATQDLEGFMSKILAIKGIGPWTANYIAMKALRHTDAFPETDLILARALNRHPKKVIEQMRPWRGYVAALLWREYAGVLKKTKTKKKRGSK